jgi:hypothetical protein
MATIIPMTTKTTIATCVQIHTGDIAAAKPTKQAVWQLSLAVRPPSIVYLWQVASQGPLWRLR